MDVPFLCYLKIATRNCKTPPNTAGITCKISVLFLFMAGYLHPVITHASWYTGGSVLLHLFPYRSLHTNYITLGSSRTDVLSNGISINAGYKFCLCQFVLASELDVGAFSDADGDVDYKGLEHYVSASYYLALKQKFGYHIRPNWMPYALIGLSQNSIGDRVYSTAQYYNKKQISFLAGLGLEYYTMRDDKVALFAEWFYFTPTGMTLYSGGAKTPSRYSISTYGAVLELGMRYYFD